jgi:hypothetical protein
MPDREDDPAFVRQRAAAYEYFGLWAPTANDGPRPTMDELVIAVHEKFRELEERLTLRGI